MVKLFVIYGCHGAGKTTLAKNILNYDGRDHKEYTNEFGTYTVSENKHIVAVGKYSIKCGGADSLKGTEYYYKMLRWLINEKIADIILIEGIFLSALFKKPLQEFLSIKYDLGVDVYQVFLYADEKTSYERVLGRNGKPPKKENIRNKARAVKNNMIKFRQLNEFPSVLINTVGKTSKQVLQEFSIFFSEV